MTQRELASALTVSEAAVSKWLRETGGQTWRRVSDICGALDISADYLLGLSDDPTPRTRHAPVTAYDMPRLEDLPVLTWPVVQQHSVDKDGTKVLCIFGADYIPIARMRDPIAAGPGIISSGAIDELFLMPLSWVRRWITGPIPMGRIGAVDVTTSWVGESMRPTILPGACLMVDFGAELAGVTFFEPGQLYLVHTPTGNAVKRVWLTGECWNCHSDNRTHPPVVLPVNRRRGIGATLIARVFHISNPAE